MNGNWHGQRVINFCYWKADYIIDGVVNKYGNLKSWALYLNYSSLKLVFQQWNISTVNPLAFVL